MAEAPARPKLLELAARRFDTISPAEQKLFDAAADGKDADCASLPERDRVIQADRFVWLCTNSDASAQVTYRGVSIVGAEIDGKLDLEWAKISFPILAWKCVFRDAIILSRSQIAYLNLAGSTAKQLKANSTQFGGSVFLHFGFIAEGPVNLIGATIGGDLNCTGGQFAGGGKALALSAGGAKIQGEVFMSQGFKAEGGVDFIAARIGRNLSCDGGQFVGKGEIPALNGNSAQIGGGVYLRAGFKAEGGVNLVAATIGGNLDCDGSEFVSKGDIPALDASSARIEGGVYLRRGFRAEGRANFIAARIGGNLSCIGGQFVSKGDIPALDADSAKIDGSVYFRGEVVADGTVRLTNASIGRGFQWREVKSPEKATLDLTLAKCQTLWHDQNSWPSKGNLGLFGFVYDQIDDEASPNAEVQLRWLRLQSGGPIFISTV
jgi:hypothetical protein